MRNYFPEITTRVTKPSMESVLTVIPGGFLVTQDGIWDIRPKSYLDDNLVHYVVGLPQELVGKQILLRPDNSMMSCSVFIESRCVCESI